MSSQYLFIVNPLSGAGKGETIARLLNRLLPSHPSFCEGRGTVLLANDPDPSALRAELARADVAVAVGGDGTVSRLMPNMLACDPPPTLGLIPIGTSNDLGRSLGWEINEDYTREPILAKMLDRIAGARVDELDVFSVNDSMLFSNYFSIGFDAAIVRDFGRIRESNWARSLPQGRSTNNALYFLMGLKHVGFFLEPPLDIDYVHRDEACRERLISRCRAVILSNLPVYAGGCPIRHDAARDDGVFEITVVYTISQYLKIILTRFIPFLRLPRGLGRFRAKEASIAMRRPYPAQMDGESCPTALDTSPRFRISFRARIRVLVPGPPL